MLRVTYSNVMSNILENRVENDEMMVLLVREFYFEKTLVIIHTVN